MANSDKIGIYLTDEIIVLADFNRNKLQRVVSSPLDNVLNSPQDSPFSSDTTGEVQIVSFIQKLFREHKITPGQICVSIPIQEVFLRSFVIPWMSPNELNNAVYYEAKKYLPFDLKQLDYIFQPVAQTENNQKRWRIIFYAVRKQTIEKYDRIIKQIGGKALVFEPSLVSLAKHLVSKNYLRLDQSAVVVYIHNNDVHIIFYEKGIAYFVRDFILSVSETHDPKAFSETVRTQLLREIRKSFGYYNSQFSQEKIKEILILSVVTDQELSRLLAEELSVKVRIVEPSITAGLQKYVGMDTMSACGACLEKVSSKFTPFNFLQTKSSQQTAVNPGGLSFDLGQMLGLSASDFKPAIQAAILCSLILGGVVYFGQAKLQEVKKQYDKMTQTEGPWLNKSAEQISEEIKTFSDKLANYKKIQNRKSRMATYLVVLTKSLPSGVWLNDAKISYSVSDRLTIELTGYVYLKVKGGEYKAINEFLDNLRSDKNFSDLTFNLNSQQKKVIDNSDVVAFSVTAS